jgi:hypothetical protein
MYAIDERIIIVETHIRKRYYVKCRKRFIHKYPDSPVPRKSCVTKLIKWLTVGSVLDKTRHRKKTVLTHEKLEDILAWLQISPRKFLRRLSQETGVSAGCTSKATKLIKLRLRRVGVVHEFKPTNAPQGFGFLSG